MTELHFRERDRPMRLNPGALIPAVIGVAVQTLVLVHRTGPGGLWIAGGTLALAGAWWLLARRRAETVADERGVSINWGFGRGRTIPWADVRWLDYRVNSNQAGSYRTARITRRNGRRRSLPGMSSSELYPNPALDANFQQLHTLWLAHQDPALTATPPVRTRFLRRWRGVIPGTLAVLALGLTIAGTVAAVGQRHDLAVLDSFKDCGLSGIPSADLCLPQSKATVVSVSAQTSFFGKSVAGLQDPGSGYLWNVTFGAANPLVQHARPGESVLVTTDLGDSTVESVRYQGHDYPTTDSPLVEPSRAEGEIIFLASLAVLLAAWAVASLRRRRRPSAPYPWWAPLCLPAVAWAFAVSAQLRSAPTALSWGLYVPGLVLLAFGLTAGAWLGHRRREREQERQIQSVVAAA